MRQQPSRPDLRVEPVDDAPSTPTPSPLEMAGREPAPWWANILFAKLSNDDQFRRVGSRLGELELLTDKHEQQLTGTQQTNAEIAKERARRREKWGDRVWMVVGGLLLALLLWGAQWLHCSPPKPSTTVQVQP